MARRLVLATALLMAMASAAAAQSSGPAPGATQPPMTGGNGAGLNGPAAPNARSAASCTADNSCATFPLTPLGAASPSLAPRTSPAIGTAPSQAGSAIAAPPLVATPNAIGGVNQTSGINRTGTTTANPAAGTPATRAPSMSSNAFQTQCANSTSCGDFQGR